MITRKIFRQLCQCQLRALLLLTSSVNCRGALINSVVKRSAHPTKVHLNTNHVFYKE